MTKVKHSEEHDRGDGVKYGTSCYELRPKCPKCGADNGVKIVLSEGKQGKDLCKLTKKECTGCGKCKSKGSLGFEVIVVCEYIKGR
jgi:hypothetical protein